MNKGLGPNTENMTPCMTRPISTTKSMPNTTIRLAQRILAIQSEVGKLSKDLENPFFKSKYFDINQVVEALLPLLAKHGVTVTQPLSHIWDKVSGVFIPAIETIVEANGESRSYLFPMGQIDKPQNVGAAVTYYRRYCLQSLFLLQAEDDDGKPKMAKGAPAQTTAQKFSKAKEMIGTMNKTDLGKAHKNIQASKIYNAKQKAELMDALMARGAQLK